MSNLSSGLQTKNLQPSLFAKAYLLSFGAICHLSFLLAVSIMAFQLYFGMDYGLGKISTPFAYLADLILLLSFPIIHSILLTKPGSKILNFISPRGWQTSTTTYVLIASLQLLLVFVLWTPSHVTLIEISYPYRYFFDLAFFVSWPLLGLAMLESGPGIQFGYSGWLSALIGKKIVFPKFCSKGLHSICRHPIYYSFFLALVSSPIWTIDHLMIACVWGSYCLIGPIFKEKRYKNRYGQEFVEYQQKVPYFPGTPR